MVAKRFASGRAVAVAIVAILTFSILPTSGAQIEPPVQPPTVPNRNFSIEQGEAYFEQGGVVTSFMRNVGEISLYVRVIKSTDDAVPNVPVYWWFEGSTTRVGCQKVSFGEGETEREVKLGLGLPTMAAGEHTVHVAVLYEHYPASNAVAPPGAETWDYPSSTGCSTPHHLPLTSDTTATCTTTPERCSNDASTDNNHVTAYLIKDRFLDLRPLSFQWCEETYENWTDACDDNMLRPEGNPPENVPYNITPTIDCGDERKGVNESCLTHFRLVVENRGNWTNATDEGGRPYDHDNDGTTPNVLPGWTYDLNVTLRHANGSQTYVSRTVHMLENTTTGSLIHTARSSDWSLVNTSGVYNVTLRIDPNRSIHRAYNDNHADSAHADGKKFWDKNAADLSVYYREYGGNFTTSLLRTTPENPYPHAGSFTIAGNVQFNNTGTYNTTNPKISVKIYLDNLSWTDASGEEHENTLFITQEDGIEIPSKGKVVIPFSWEYTSTVSATRYLPPGRHTVYAIADSGEDIPEPNETNNNISIDIFVQDTSKPKVTGLKTVLDETGNGPSSPNNDVFRPMEPFNVYVNVTDDDNQVKVHANFTLNSNNSVYRIVNLTRNGATSFYGHIPDFKFHNFTNVTFDGTENWTMVVVANDSFSNLANSTPKPFKLKGWPIHNASADFVIEMPSSYPHYEIAWADGEDPRFNIRVLPNATGFTGEDPIANQQNYTGNLAYNVTTLKKTHAFGPAGWTLKTDMLTCGPAEDDGVPDLPVNTPSPACDESTNNTFEAIFPKDQPDGTAGPGLWNYSIMIKDIAGYVRAINGTILINDTPPRVLSSNLSATNVTPNQEVRIRANISDDDADVDAAHAVFTRPTSSGNVTVNLSLTTVNQTPGGYYEFNQSFPTGRYQQLGYGGTFNVSIHARDGTGNWNFSYLGNFTVNDDEPPVLTGFGVIPATAEVGENVTFWANISDATNSTAELRIFRGVGTSELLTPEPIIINQSTTSNYTYTMNFSTENIYAWTITPVDSLVRVGGAGSGTISVRDNLGPKYDVRGPSTVIDGVRYGTGTPRIEVIVQDVEGVLASSVDMAVAGLPVDFDLLPAPGSINGYLVSYAVPTGKKFNHNDIVEINLTAKDGSAEALESTFTFNFTVDDVAPTTRLISISPSYRDQPGHVLNVSLNSKFTLAAEDVDGLPTGVPEGGIRYRILGGGPGAAETVYSGPFKINDASGVYTGPRLYQVQFWAEDAVGNFNRNPNTTTVFVDDTPPALFQFFPQGRDINATFVDDRVGVDRGVVWYRVNEQPYVPLPLVEREGAWTITLPEAVKTDRICYYLQAWDRLDNTETFGNQTAPYACFDVSNHEPRIRIRTPADGSTVSRSFELSWEASDEDGDALVFTVYVRRPGQQNFAELTRIENTEARRYVVDSTKYPDGQYTFRVAAGDGGFVKLSETTVSILNKADPVGKVTVTGDALPGSSMLVTAEITKAEAIVEARLYLGETLVGSYPMNDQGNNGDVTAGDGTYSTLVPISAAGDYRVEIYTSYREDGQTKESSVSNAATFSAKLTPSYILSEYAAIIALIGLLAAVGIGVGVFVVMRRR